jgi:hypothetical protein
MRERKIRLILFLCLVLILNGCSSQGVTPSQNALSTDIAVEQTGTALAASGVLKTPSFVLATPSISTALLTPTGAPSVSNGVKLAVVMIKYGEVLNLRSSPGDQNGAAATIQPHTTDIKYTGNSHEVDGKTWFEVRTPENALGWVKADDVTEQASSTQFCADSKVTALITQFMNAVQTRDGEKLAQLVSPRRGLIIRHEWWNPEVQFIGQDVLKAIFNDTTSRDWGVQEVSGLPINGSFKDEILPKIDDVQSGAVQTCNSLNQGLSSGGDSGYIEWPFEYTNFNYVAIYRAAQAGDELNWRTWAIGVEYVNEIPYVALLVQYHWEN